MQEIYKHLKDAEPCDINLTGLSSSSSLFLAARQAESTKDPVLFIVASEEQLHTAANDLKLFTDLPVLVFPAYEIPPYTRLSPDKNTTASRIATIYQAANAQGPFIMLASCEALLRRIQPLAILEEMAELIISGEETDPEELRRTLIRAGYEHVSLVQNSGEFSMRGGIIDIYPPSFSTDNKEAPLRLDFFCDTIESIRYFDPISQRSIEEIDEAVLLPVTDTIFSVPRKDFHDQLKGLSAANDAEINLIYDKLKNEQRFPGIEFFLPLFYDELATPIACLPRETIVFINEPLQITTSINLTRERIEANFTEATASKMPAMAPGELFLTEDELADQLQKHRKINIHEIANLDLEPQSTFDIKTGNHILIKQELELARNREGLITALSQICQQWLTEKHLIALTCGNSRNCRQYADFFTSHGFKTELCQQAIRPETMLPGKIHFFPGNLSQGFDLFSENFHLLSLDQLIGNRKVFRPRQELEEKTEPIRFEELHPGEYVVHNNHGIGIFQGIIHLVNNNIAGDFIEIAYQDNDKLFVPVDRLNTISKYHGISDQPPGVGKLGGKSWEKIKKKVSEAVWKVAQDLLNLYARRELATGYQFSPPASLYNLMEENFPFEETAGQQRAINDVINDLTSPQTMDRLICGDVGYGKTEVAIRGSFKVVEDGFQVAILVPTTVLAEQHVNTFQERLTDLPVRVASLNRFRSAREQKEIINDCVNGKIDILIGTHRLLSKDVNFKKLGLLIIDEEHRFGVSHKEKIKRFKNNVDVMTMTATPIPRTLQLSLLGVRDLSVISSPPRHRRSVKTFIARSDDLVIREAIIREIQRKGQVFFVHNRVHSIQETARRIQKLVPQARISVAHGQMPARTLEDIMVSFSRRQVDVMISTTIIESGLDIPEANTIIIDRADRFGLAEIYQLRGRVGRSNVQAFAYLLVPSVDGLTKDARQRLRALMDYNELGGGFKLAMSDLQIRGGGNILGTSQSGNIAAVGYDLYLDLLQKTVEDLKKRASQGEDYLQEEIIEPELNLQVPAFIPDKYITSTDQRYISYRKITSIDNIDMVTDLEDELRDRFGPLPSEVKNLFQIIILKLSLSKMKITKVDQGPGVLAFTFHPNSPVDPQKIMAMVQNKKTNARFTPEQRLIIKTEMESTAEVFVKVKKILQALSE